MHEAFFCFFLWSTDSVVLPIELFNSNLVRLLVLHVLSGVTISCTRTILVDSIFSRQYEIPTLQAMKALRIYF